MSAQAQVVLYLSPKDTPYGFVPFPGELGWCPVRLVRSQLALVAEVRKTDSLGEMSWRPLDCEMDQEKATAIYNFLAGYHLALVQGEQKAEQLYSIIGEMVGSLRTSLGLEVGQGDPKSLCEEVRKRLGSGGQK